MDKKEKTKLIILSIIYWFSLTIFIIYNYQEKFNADLSEGQDFIFFSTMIAVLFYTPSIGSYFQWKDYEGMKYWRQSLKLKKIVYTTFLTLIYSIIGSCIFLFFIFEVQLHWLLSLLIIITLYLITIFVFYMFTDKTLKIPVKSF